MICIWVRNLSTRTHLFLDLTGSLCPIYIKNEEKYKNADKISSHIEGKFGFTTTIFMKLRITERCRVMFV